MPTRWKHDIGSAGTGQSWKLILPMVVIGVLSGHVFMMVSLLGSDLVCSNILCTTGSWRSGRDSMGLSGDILVSFFLCVHT